MQTVLIVVHLMIVLALVGVVLIQRSEGGGLGIGGGSGFMSARGTANALTRTTAILATLFFITSMALGLLARYESRPSDILDRIPAGTSQGNGVLDQLGGSTTPAPAAGTQQPATPESPVPTTGTQPAAPAAPAPAPATGAETKPAEDANTSGVPTGQ
ncbi:preprotein translocase subunit SecG [Rhizobiaceae bacterium n13]|uniref:Protein-export membrane protein SecG n=1 Tax=Ferirhizobium litorale TaxID=2927786 RepID=A0AAE3QEQ9_9HYPH|nr:preprotein translocase subunit SecG [Fererhizobium litorale]MDI7864065.1 preprotein translocase subunit SecG [Fererhizobium litorale]MDI7924452.1 preprotein translocase subunit SecG [Fererhizobium litorale]